jgi:hypothetical protein
VSESIEINYCKGFQTYASLHPSELIMFIGSNGMQGILYKISHTVIKGTPMDPLYIYWPIGYIILYLKLDESRMKSIKFKFLILTIQET